MMTPASTNKGIASNGKELMPVKTRWAVTMTACSRPSSGIAARKEAVPITTAIGTE